MSKPNLVLLRDDATEGVASCKAVRQIVDRIRDKWTVMVVGCLSNGSMRFTTIQRTMPGVSHRMLTLTVCGMVRDGLVKRTAHATIRQGSIMR
ncbi:hypothetical protein CQ13_11875 [Bradyrhizobium retamae]|uniref:HTH hxlR-type domain-containing protein n=1 Tax=Bradyrhizobium retamae TaxID=1300035 RepID=A0A0R3MAD2_9BRAD|nr:helix-turn-helix domain-containing protein [Bradyrhizobium retamae]KRR16905.1 hypothetical protein CQ13_11875 [Bradyrhizobium retamae]